MRAILLVLIAIFAPGFAAASPSPVDTALILVIDVSLSVDDGRYALQRDGTAAALESDAVGRAIISGPNQAVEIAIVEFSDPDRQTIVLPWTRIASAADARQLAARVRAIRRSSHGLTDLAEAVLAAGALFDSAPLPATHRIIDLSSDGMSNIGTPMMAARDALVAQGITINGLPILTEEPWLGEYYEQTVIGGPDSFVEIATDLGSFRQAMERKLAREMLVSGLAQARINGL